MPKARQAGEQRAFTQPDVGQSRGRCGIQQVKGKWRGPALYQLVRLYENRPFQIKLSLFLSVLHLV